MEQNQNQMTSPSITEPTGQAIPGKEIAIIAYLTIIGLIAAFIMNNDKRAPFASYHIRQVLGLAVTGLAIGVISIVPILGWLIAILAWIPMLIMWIAGLVNAIGGKQKPMPILGKKYEEWFAGVGN